MVELWHPILNQSDWLIGRILRSNLFSNSPHISDNRNVYHIKNANKKLYDEEFHHILVYVEYQITHSARPGSVQFAPLSFISSS